MPRKIYEKVKLPSQQPDMCELCPLLGRIPPEEREPGSQETLVCLGTGDAMNTRIARSRASKHDSKHPLKRWCDKLWERWQMEPLYGNLPVRIVDLCRYRDPYIRSRQLVIKFHSKRGPKKE